MLLPSSRAGLLSPMFGQLPRSEVFGRRYYGRNVDLVAIENAILMAQVGVMSPMSDLARESLQRDPAVSGMLFRRFANLSACDWDVQPPSSGVDFNRAQQIADVTRTALLRFKGFRQMLYDMAWGAFDGRAAVEIDWQATSGPVRFWPTGHTWIHPGRLSFGPNRDLRVVERHKQSSLYFQVGVPLDDLTPGKVVQWTPRAFNEYPEREGLAPRLLYWLFFKRFSWRHRMTLTELFGIPWRVIETMVGPDVPLPSAEALDEAAAVAEDLGAETTLALEPGMTLKVHPPHPESGTLFGMNSNEINDECAKLILLQPKTSTGDTNRAAGVIADKQQDAALVFDGTGLAEAITEQLVRPFVAMNWGTDDLVYAPRLFLRTDPPRDRKADLERANIALGMGLPLAAAEVYEVSGFRRPRDGEAQIKGRVPPAPGAQGAPPAAGAPGGPMPTAGALPPPAGGGGTLQEEGEGEGLSVSDAVAHLLDAYDTDMLNAPDDGSTDTGLAAMRVPRLEVDLELAMAGAPLLPLPPEQQWLRADLLSLVRGLGEDVKQRLVEHAHPVISLAEAGVGRVLQPSSANGSPEPLIAAGVKEAAKHVEAWALELAQACEGEDQATALYSRLAKRAMSMDGEKFTRAVERRLVHGLMLGALDSHVEIIGDAPLKPTAFEREEEDGRLELATATIADFATKPFAEAIKAFGSKRILTRRSFDRLAAEAKRKAFTVAGLARTSMLEVAHDELSKAIVAGDDLRTFRRQLGARFEAAGLSRLNPSHVETVFRTNVMGAYSDGRHAQMTQPEVLAARPFWQILGVKDDRARAPHAAAHAKVLAASDPFWSRARPPWGYNCRCRVVSRSAADLERLGLKVSSGAELTGLPDDGWS